MEKTTISFRTHTETRDELDKVAAALDRDRSHVLNEAISIYLDIQREQIRQIEEGLRQADAGEFVDEADWRAAFRRGRR